MRKIQILLMLISGLVQSEPMTNQQAADAGKLLGQTQDALITPQINQANADTKIKHVTGAPAETQFFGGGKADNFTPGDSKRIACNTGTPSTDAFTQQSCDAVNLIANAPSQRPQFTIDRNNPMLQREQSVRADAAVVAFGETGTGGSGASNPNGFGIAGTYSDCTTTTTPDPGTTEIRTCVDYMTATETTTNPTCQKSVATAQSCHQVMSFTVTSIPTCSISGSYTARLGLYDISFGCDQSNTFAIMTISITPSAQCHAGGCNSDYFPLALNIIPGVSTTATANLARVYWGGWWTPVTVQYAANTNYVSIVIGPDDGVIASCPSGTIQTKIGIGIKAKTVCAANPTCPAGASSFLARLEFTDADGNFFPALYACAPNPTCPAGASSFLFKAEIVDDNGVVVAPAQYVCGPGVDPNVPFSGSIGIQWVAAEAFVDNCTNFQTKTQ